MIVGFALKISEVIYKEEAGAVLSGPEAATRAGREMGPSLYLWCSTSTNPRIVSLFRHTRTHNLPSHTPQER
jgi:hypothetical protein